MVVYLYTWWLQRASEHVQMWPPTFPFHLFVLIDACSICPGQSDNLLNLLISTELSQKCFGVTRVNFSFYLILTYNSAFPSSGTAPQKQSNPLGYFF